MNDQAERKGAPGCGLWLRIGPDLALDVLVRDLNQIFYVINASRYEKNMHALEITGNAENALFRESAQALFSFARGKGITCIFRGDGKTAKDLGADGVLLESADHLAEAKDLFGPEGIVGLSCGLSNEAAAAAYDADADFVTFGTGKDTMPDAAILKFWTMLTDRPAVIEGPVTNDYCAYYIDAGASFIDAGSYIFSHGRGVMQATVNMLHAIDLALDEKNDRKIQ